MFPGKIISGGQTGADRAGLDFAIRRGIPHGGWCPLGRRAEDGRIPSAYQLVETDSPDYPVRTEINVQRSDATLIFSLPNSPGSKLTQRLCQRHGKPCLHIRVDDYIGCEDEAGREIADFLREYAPKVLNVAGSRQRSSFNMHRFVTKALDAAYLLCEQGPTAVERDCVAIA